MTDTGTITGQESKSKKEIISEVVEDINKTMPVIKNLLESVSFSLNSGNFEEANRILSPTITSLNFISQMISALESEAGDGFSSIKINGEDIISVQKRWIHKLEDLKNSINKRDIVRAADIISYEFPYEIDCQMEILKKLLRDGGRGQ